MNDAELFIVDDDALGQRLDVFVAAKHPTISRSYIRKIIDADKVTVNNQPVKAGHKLRFRDAVRIPDVTQAANVAAPVADIPIIFEDDDSLVMSKPIGLLTHARGGTTELEASVASFLRQHVSNIDGDRAGIVHRLDRATSGVIIGAKNPEALSWLQKQFSQRKTKKTYYAIVSGHLQQAEAIIDMPIERNPKAPATFRVGANGKTAQTHYIVERETEHYSLVKMTPETGRTHQLRVHMAHIGHPIVGDVLYNGKSATRLYLHAYSLELTLLSRERKVFTADVPAAFAELLDNDR